MNVCHFGCVFDVLPHLAGLGARCCVTSPPYWGLRDYGMPGQLGAEPTLEEYVANMVRVFGLVRDCLSDDGTLWLNLGDSYSSMRDSKVTPDSLRGDCVGTATTFSGNRHPAALRAAGLKHKDLIGVPWEVAFALRTNGWYLRKDIIWHKPNPTPESVRDRPTSAHEHLFLLAKQERYYYDADAIKEDAPWERWGAQKHQKALVGKANLVREASKEEIQALGGGKRNKRDVWTVASRSYRGAHFATYPPALIEPCILAGSAPGDIVLDPFMGSGTTAMVAQALGRRWVGVELNPEYRALQDERTEQFRRIDEPPPQT